MVNVKIPPSPTPSHHRHAGLPLLEAWLRALLRLNLRMKLILATVVLVASVLLLAISLLSHHMRNVIRDHTRQRGIAIARIFASGANLTHLKTYNYRMLQVNARLARRESRLLYVVVYDKEGKVAAHSEDASLINTHPTGAAARQSLQARNPLFRQLNHRLLDGSSEVPVFDFTVPVLSSESRLRWGTVRLGFLTDGMRQRVREIQSVILKVGLAAVVAGILGARILANRITDPVSTIAGGAVRASAGDLSHRIQVKTGDELEGLANHFNDMMDRIRQSQEERIKTEKLAAVGNMVNTIVHDCRTPITVIKGFSSLLSDHDLSSNKKQECLAFIHFEIERMERMLDEILHFARDKKTGMSVETCNLDQVLRNCCIEIQALFRDNKTRFVQKLDCDAPVAIDKDKFRRALLNIAVNAKDALKGRGTFAIRSHTRADQACIRLTDDGVGIPPHLQATLFQPFFTQGKHTGFGLGMSITRKIIEDHAGTIAVESQVGRGTSFLVSIPLAGTAVHKDEKRTTNGHK